MDFDKWASKTFLTIGEAVNYLSEKRVETQDLMNPNRIRGADVLRFALDGDLPLVVDVPTGTEDGEGRAIEAGIWDLPLEGAGRQQIEYNWRVRAGLAPSDIVGITGAWLERDGVQRQLEPIANRPSAIGASCVLGCEREALDAFLAEKMPPADDLDKDAKTVERTALLAIIAVLAKMAKIDVSKPSQAAKQITRNAELLNIKISARTVERHLHKISDALLRRS